MDKKTTRRLKVKESLGRKLQDLRTMRNDLQAQSYNVVLPTDDELRISSELYAVRVALGEISESVCIF